MTYTYEEAFDATKNYFNGNDLSTKVFVDKYALRDVQGNYLDLTPHSMHDRLAREFAKIDARYDGNYDDRFGLYRQALDKFARIVPQGSPMSAVGNTHQRMSASNCVVIESPRDDMGAIVDAGKELAQLYKRRCGVGLDISELRPEGAPVRNAARTTTGAWSFADFYSYITRMVGQNSRRGALMITMSVHHPDVVKFITMKHDETKVTGANVSLRLSDEFLQAVENDEEYEVRWPLENPKISSKLRAREVWNTIVESATNTAEPGLIMWDNMTRELPAHYYPSFKSISTNPCCFAQDSQVTVITKKGLKDIKNISSSDLVWIDSERVWAKTSCYFDAGESEVFQVLFSNGEKLFITENHKLEKLSRYSGKNRKVAYARELVELKNLSEGDIISLHKNEVLETGSDVGSYEDGVLLGWLAGDGCLSYKSSSDIWPTMYLAFWSQEYDVAEKLLEISKSYLPNHTLQEYDDGNGNIVKRISSSYLTRLLTEKYETNLWNFRKGYNSLLYNVSLDFVKGYLSAYFSADGTVANTPQQSRYCIQLGSVNKEGLFQVKNLLNLFGIRCHIGLSKVECRTKIRNKYYNCANLYRLSITGYDNLLRFNKYIGFVSKYKQDSLNRIFDNFKQEGRTREAYCKIRSIESVGVKKVGCIEVDHFHSFTANGIISGNSEIALSAYDSCRLISINLTGYVRNAFEKTVHFDMAAFKKDVELAQRMADNLVDIELDLIDRIKAVCGSKEEKELWNKLYKAGEKGRRTGVGTHGLGDTLAQLCLKYDSEESLAMVDKIYRNLRNTAYSTSIDLAEERGAFPDFDWELEKNCPYIKRLPKSLRDRMEKVGRRNISLLTQAPTGSVSMLSKVGAFDTYNVSSGVEPVFRNSYTRRKKINPGDENIRVDYVDLMGDSWQEFKVYHSNVANYLTKNPLPEGAHPSAQKLPDYFVTSDQIDWEKRVEIQGTEQQYIDHSISSCLAEGHHLVHTSDGLQYIEDIVGKRLKRGFSPISSTNTINHRNEQVPITEGFYNGVSECYKVSFSGQRSIIGTHNHKLLTINEDLCNFEWKQIRDITPNTFVVGRMGLGCFGDSQKHFSTALGKFETNVSGGSTKKVKLPNRMSKKLARLLGYLTSDGSVSDNGIQLSQLKNNIVDDFINIVKDVFGLECYVCPDNRVNGLVSVQVNSRILRDFVRYLGVTGKSHEKTVPRSIFKCAGRAQTAEFIKGLTLDGFVSESKIGVMTSASQSLCSEIQTILDQYGIDSGIVKSNDEGTIREFPGGKYATKNAWTVYCGLNESQKFVEFIGFAEDRKSKEVTTKLRRPSRKSLVGHIPDMSIRQAFKNNVLYKIKSNKLYEMFHSMTCQSKQGMDLTRDALLMFSDMGLSDTWYIPEMLDDTFIFRKVLSCHPVGVRNTYDISVENGKSYVVNNIVSHNTINLPKGTEASVVSQVYMAAWKKGLKGVTVYVDGSRDGVLITDSGPDTDADGRPTKLVHTDSPKRPKELQAEIHHATVKGVKWTVLIGLLHNEPYELFMGQSDSFNIAPKHSEGKLFKLKGGMYNLLDVTNNVLVENVIGAANNDEGAWTTRMMSMSLRHGVPIEYLVEQLSKDGSVVDVNMVLGRLLRKYIKKKSQSSEACPQCGSNSLIYEDSCNKCIDCGFSGCQ